MIFYYTRSASHLKPKDTSINFGSYTSNNFCDGELYLKLDNSNNAAEDVWVFSSTESPADNIMELCFLLDALNRNKAKINIFFTYFGYARQDRSVSSTESLSAQVVSNFFKQFKIEKIIVLHPHSERLHDFLKFNAFIPYELYSPIINEADLVLAPDQGAKIICEQIATEHSKEFAWLDKYRPTQEEVQVLKLHGNVKNKKVIIFDDVITTGNTIIKATNYLIEQGAKSIEVIATHGIFCNNAIENINSSKIAKVYTTNSIKKAVKSPKIEQLDLSKTILNYCSDDR